MTTRAERASAIADEVAQERGPADARVGYPSPGFIRAIHPDTGITVTFVPGELLPTWAVDALPDGKVDVTTGAMVLPGAS